MINESRNLLYIAPVAPARAGNGLAMRTGAVLRALAGLWRVHLLVVPIYPSPLPMAHDELRSICAATATFAAGDGPAGTAGESFIGVRFEIVHHVRLATLRFGAPYLRSQPAARPRIDLDDVESVSRRRLAAVYRLNGREADARTEEAEADRAEMLERTVLRDFDRVYVCSTVDRDRLGASSSAEIRVLPNVIDRPPLGSTPVFSGYGEGWLVTPARPLNLLFVGTLGYAPNEDAVLYFCRSILPLIREASPRPVHLCVAGSGATPSLLALSGDPGIQIAGFSPELRALYGRADVVVVPLRAGGGTRIKILEAFAYRRPVVSTFLGAEGLNAVDGEDLLLADSPERFAASCLRLAADPALGRRLVAGADALLRDQYSLDAARHALN